MKNILVIQFREKKEPREAEQRCLLRATKTLNTKLTFLNALDESINWENPGDILKGYDGVMLGGSGEFYFDGKFHPEDPKRARLYTAVERMRLFFHFLLENDFPTFGMCMGHQAIAHIIGTKIIACDKTGKTGTFNVHLSKEGLTDPLFAGFPEEFPAQYAHKDVVSELPEGATALANGERCSFSVIRYGKNIYTMQFHPEMNYEDMRERIEVHPEYMPEGVDPDQLLKPSPEANTLIPLFVERVVAP